MEFEIGGKKYIVRDLTHKDQMSLEKRWKIVKLTNRAMRLSEQIDIAYRKGKTDRVDRLMEQLDEVNELYFTMLSAYNVDRLVLTTERITDPAGTEIEVTDEYFINLPIPELQELIDKVFAWQNRKPENIYEDIVDRFGTYLEGIDDDAKIPIGKIKEKWSELLQLEINGALKKKS